MSYVIPPAPYINCSSSAQQASTVPPNAAHIITFNSVDAGNGISLVSNSQITFSSPGKYLISFSAVCDSLSQSQTMKIWYVKNVTPIANSTTVVFIGAANEPIVMTVPLIVSVVAGDYVELHMSATSTNAVLLPVAATAGPPVVPAAPSIILTANKISD